MTYSLIFSSGAFHIFLKPNPTCRVFLVSHSSAYNFVHNYFILSFLRSYYVTFFCPKYYNLSNISQPNLICELFQVGVLVSKSFASRPHYIFLVLTLPLIAGHRVERPPGRQCSAGLGEAGHTLRHSWQ